MAIAVPTAGNPILDTWGADVANRLNQLVPLILESDTATDVAEGSGGVQLLTITVTAGREYNVQLFGIWEASATNQGLRVYVGESSGAGTVRGHAMIGNPASGLTDYTVTDSTWNGSTSTSAATSDRAVTLSFVYACTTTGVLEVKMARGGTSGGTGVTMRAGFGGLCVESPA